MLVSSNGFAATPAQALSDIRARPDSRLENSNSDSPSQKCVTERSC